MNLRARLLALVGAICVAAGTANALSMPALFQAPLARCADRAELIVIGRDRFVLPRASSGRGIPVSGVAVDTVLAGRLSRNRGAGSTMLQVGWLGPASWAPRGASGKPAIWFLSRSAGGWVLRWGMAPRPVPRTADEAGDSIDSLGAFDAVPGSPGRVALLRYFEAQARLLPKAPGARFRNVRVVPGR